MTCGTLDCPFQSKLSVLNSDAPGPRNIETRAAAPTPTARRLTLLQHDQGFQVTESQPAMTLGNVHHQKAHPGAAHATPGGEPAPATSYRPFADLEALLKDKE